MEKLLVSFDIVSLFTPVAFQETLQICIDALYRSHLDSPSIPENLFLEFMHLATEGVEFSFNNIMYAQMDGISMRPVLANIFVGFYEHHLFESCHKPFLNLRYDTFSFFNSFQEAGAFHLNSLHQHFGLLWKWRGIPPYLFWICG